MECSSSLQHLIVIILDCAEPISLSHDMEAPLKPLRTCSKGSIYLRVTAPPIVQGELECRLPDSIHICSPSQFNSLQLQPCYFCAKIDYAEFKSVCSEMHPVNNLMELIFMSFQSQLFCGSMNGSNDSGEYFGAL